MKSKRLFVLLILMGFSTAITARAEAPVVDLSRAQQDTSISQSLEIDQEDPSPPSTRSSSSHVNEPIDQRVLRLERQIANLTDMNYASKLEKMQQEMQQLHGQIEVQDHDLLQLKEQVKNFYQDLDQRVSKLAPNEAPNYGKKVFRAENDTNSVTNTTSFVSADTNKTKELQTYETAFNLLNKKDYDKAISGFQAFIKDYPDSTYAGNAHYWLGEIYYLRGKPDSANKEFQTIITTYPDNTKVADATLKVALIAMDAGNYAKARLSFTKVQKQFPGTTAAKIAVLRLKEIKQKQ